MESMERMSLKISKIMDKDFVKKTWIIICEDLKDIDNYTGSETNTYSGIYSDMLIKCTKNELADVLLDLYKDKDKKVIEYFEYKSDEYYMYREGDNYDVNKNYKDEISS